MKKLRIFAALSVASSFALLPLIVATPAYATCINTAQAATIAAAAEPTAVGETPTVTTLATCGGDDISYQVPITATVTFDGVQYDSVYATTNSVITFGAPDGTYWTYPSTPSISLYSMDWVVYPQWRQDEHLIIQSSDGGFQVDISARPIWLQGTPTPTNIVITAAINTDGTVAMSYLVTGPTYENETRTGVRLTNGEVVTLAEYGVTQVETAPVLSAAPVDTSTVTSPSDSQTSIVDTPTSTPTPPVIPQGAVVVPEGSTATVNAVNGKRVATVAGYYGDPNDGSRGIDVSSTLTSMFAGSTSFTVTASNEFSDPAPGTVKVLIFLVTYEDVPQPIPSDTTTSTVDSGSATVDTQTSQNDTSTAPGPQPVPPTPPAIVDPVPIPPSVEPEEEPAPVQPEDPEIEPEPEPEPEPVPEPLPELELEPEPEPEIEPVPAPESPSVDDLVDDAMADGTLTESEKELIAEILIADALENGLAVTAEDIDDAGLTYADLPPETPVEVRTDENGNQVIITAEVADALTLVENPAELIGAIFTDPALALLALGSLGADMSEEEREESTKSVIATVIAGGAAIQAAAVAAATTTSSSSTGGSSGGNNNAARRRETL